MTRPARARSLTYPKVIVVELVTSMLVAFTRITFLELSLRELMSSTPLAATFAWPPSRACHNHAAGCELPWLSFGAPSCFQLDATLARQLERGPEVELRNGPSGKAASSNVALRKGCFSEVPIERLGVGM
jgi:hypothetical protein